MWILFVAVVVIAAILCSRGQSAKPGPKSNSNYAQHAYGNTCDSTFQENTKFLLDIGVELLREDLKGGFIKIWYSGKNSELQIVLRESMLLRSEVGPWVLCSFSEADYNKFKNMTKMDIQKSDEFADQICLYHQYGCDGMGNTRKRWLVEHIKENYPQFELTEYSDALVMSVRSKFRN